MFLPVSNANKFPLANFFQFSNVFEIQSGKLSTIDSTLCVLILQLLNLALLPAQKTKSWRGSNNDCGFNFFI